MLLVVLLLLPVLVGAESDCAACCDLTNISITVESEECGSCITVNTMSCAGLCHTQDRSYRSPVAQHIQNACNFLGVQYETVELPGCPPGQDSSFTYPVALSCQCTQCNTVTTDCSALSLPQSSCLPHTDTHY